VCGIVGILAFSDGREPREDGEIDPIDRLFYFDIASWLVEDLLLKKDKMGMSASIEARVPYLDQDVVAFALRLPVALKVRGLKGKRVFRRLLRNRLPEEILKRPKVGFAVPLEAWFSGELATVLHATLTERDAFLAPFVSRDEMSAMCARQRAGRPVALELLSLLVLELWGRIFLRGEAPDQLADALTRSTADARPAS
jgi:asparagine synthase (glutamine-hydrolysing)